MSTPTLPARGPRSPTAGVTEPPPHRGTRALGGTAVIVGLLMVTCAVGVLHLTQGTSGIGAGDLLRALTGQDVRVGGVSVDDVFWGSRLPRLCAGAAVGVALGVAGALLQSISRNSLASPDTLAVTSGAYLALSAVAAFGLSVPLWASSAVAFTGGLLAAGLVLGLTGAGTRTTRLILAGSAVSMALDAATGMLLILFKENTTGLFAWGSGSLAQLNIDASLRSAPVLAAALVAALLLARRLDVLGLGEDMASSLGVPVRSTRITAVLCAVILTSTSVTLAGPIAFVGLGAPVLARLLGHRIPALRRHSFLIPTAGLLGALLILLADVTLRAGLGAQAAAAIPTGIPTAVLGGIVIVVLAMRLKDAHGTRNPNPAASRLRTPHRFRLTLLAASTLLVATVVVALLAGSLWLRLGDLTLWIHQDAPDLITRALDERSARVAAAVLAGAALGLAGVMVQGAVRNPLAEPGLLGITAGAGVGAVIVVTTGLGGGGRAALIAMAVTTGLLTFAVISTLAGRGGLAPDRFVLVGIGCGYALTAVTTFLLLRSDPWQTPRILTWLSGTTYGRSLADVTPVAVVLLCAVPLALGLRRPLDLLTIDEDTPRILGVPPVRTRVFVLTIAAVLAAVAVLAVGTVGFVGLIAPHLARHLAGAHHARVIPVAMVLGACLVLVADTLGRTLITPSQLPAGLMIALIGAPYFIWLLRRQRP